MKHKLRKIFTILFPLILIILIVYLYLIFPLLDNDHKREPINVNTHLWQKSGDDYLGYYYLERSSIPPISKLLKNTHDSIFVVDFSKRNRSSISLRNDENFIIPFTNNYSSQTLYCYSHFLKTRDSSYFSLFLKNANWMLENTEHPEDTVACWTNDDMIYNKYELDFGWPSAYAQGFGLSVLCRAYQVTKDSIYLKTAEKVLNAFNLHYQHGGVMDIDEEGNIWFLEYPAQSPGYVLNGMIFGIFGIYDYYRITKSGKAKRYFERGIATLENNMHRFDMGYWSAYDLLYSGFCAGFKYHKNVHIPQLKVLYQITGKEIFKIYYERFEKYMQEPYYTLFKMSFTIDAIQRRLTYKSPL